MPRISALSLTEPSGHLTAEQVQLHLPSDLGANRGEICSPTLINIEDRLREAEATDSLEELRRLLRHRTAVNQAKIKHVTGQRPNTRAREAQRRMDQRVTACKNRYRRTRAKLQQLRGDGPWQATFRELLDEDIRALNERARSTEERAEQERIRDIAKKKGDECVDEDYGVILQKVVSVGEGRRTLSWIWYSVSFGDGKEDAWMNDGKHFIP